ncbi:PLP-dependent aminotransferase family protein [Ruegeria atlantica]|uniref:MocR-like pyridoxine biosynthesis transcription factor PdxR n=1 Tax=Ruegeria atlantica TaxID=81569 RepID=UPI002494986B|nr:PLP-dependent aminotransferase family protein [Ruegeria atlantica]
MPGQTKHFAPLPFLKLDREAGTPLYLQLVQHLRRMIQNGEIKPGQKLPSTRWLREHHGIARSTLVAAFEQLTSEGYLQSQTGSGTFVNPEFPGLNPGVRNVPETTLPPRLSKRGQAVTEGLDSSYFDPVMVRPFLANIPAIDLFPHKIWGRIENRIRNRLDSTMMAYGQPGGFAPLREAICDYVLNRRGLKCSPSQVIVTTGSQQSLNLIAALLLNPGDKVLMEDPSSPVVRASFLAQGGAIVPVPVTETGAAVPTDGADSDGARLAYLTPSCQYPLGAVMPIAQRLDWMDWTRRNDAWLIEDDLDNEFMFGGRPDPAIYCDDHHARTIYVSSFNNALFPSLRLGFIIAPRALARPLMALSAVTDRGPNTWLQAVLAEFIEQGHLNTHIRRMHSAYTRRRKAMIDSFARIANPLVTLHKNTSGLRVIADLPASLPDTKMLDVLDAHGVAAYALSYYCMQRQDLNGLLLGFGCTHEDDIPAAIAGLCSCLSDFNNNKI